MARFALKIHDWVGIHHVIQARQHQFHTQELWLMMCVTIHHGGTCPPSAGSLHSSQFWSYPMIPVPGLLYEELCVRL
uniref:Uncharacterized protein n=1 Tax=Arundo donax TaxID=35708 RepID=A0A0A9CHK9_ARUDO